MSTGGGSVRELTALLSTLRHMCLQHPTHAVQLHACLLVSAGACPHPHPVLLMQLVSLYATVGRLADALRAHLPSANLHTYAVLVSALARPRPDLAFSLFSGSRRQFRPSPHVISAVLSAYAGLQPLCERGFDAGTGIPWGLNPQAETGMGKKCSP